MKAKNQLRDLAVFGGTPAFRNTLHVGRPNIGNRERLLARINDILDKKWLTNKGAYVGEFERRVAEQLNVGHCIAVCNATVGLEIVVRALAITGEVIVPSFTFIATAHALQWLGITPVFCDIDPVTHNIDPVKVEKLITPRTTAIIGVHVWGRPCDVEALTGIARRRGLKLIFDAAHAFGCSYHGRMIGGFGQAEVFSFHATKFVNTFEGGAVVTNDEKLAQQVRAMKNFGFAGDVISLGTNGKMSEISAAMGLTNLESMNEFIAINLRNYRQYLKELSKFVGISMATYDEREKNNYQYVVLDINATQTRVSRDQLMEILYAENVRARRYFHPGCHCQETYCSDSPHAKIFLPETERLASRTLCLPTGIAVGKKDISAICQILRFVVANGTRIEDQLCALRDKHL